MKILDLNAYGVQEMNAVEMQKTDGGIWYHVFMTVLGFIDSYLMDASIQVAGEGGTTVGNIGGSK